MKVYQENWLESLEEFTKDNDILGVCCEICGDDTGDTDPLTSKLAEILRNRIIRDMNKNQ
jgi:hypothetical protein